MGRVCGWSWTHGSWPIRAIFSTVLTYLFSWLSGWHRDANSVRVAGLRLPMPTRFALLSSLGPALILFGAIAVLSLAPRWSARRAASVSSMGDNK